MTSTLAGRHILAMSQFTIDDLKRLFALADRLEPFARGQMRTRALNGAVLANLFFEPSTRTRISFGAAFNRLGGFVRDTSGVGGSSLVKGESLWDSARVISGYADVIVMRHPQAGAVREFATGSRVSVINGGDGAGEHPTQALLDLYTITRRLQRTVDDVPPIVVTIVGDLKHGRAVHSLVSGLAMLPSVHLLCAAPPELDLPDEIAAQFSRFGHRIARAESLEAGLEAADIVYATRLQRERLDAASTLPQLDAFRLHQDLVKRRCKSTAVIMHPLPRDSRPEADELSTDLNDDPRLAIFAQTDNGMNVRMALFAECLGVEKDIFNSAEPTPWNVASTQGKDR